MNLTKELIDVSSKAIITQKEVLNPDRVLDLLENTKTNWEVDKIPLVTPSGLSSESFGIYKGDEWLGTVGKKYTPMQNYVLAETLTNAAENLGLKNEGGGKLGIGEKVFYQIPLKDRIVGDGNVKRFITVLNSHNGSSCIGFGSTSVVVMCQNTFYKALRDLEKIRHTQSSEERVRLAMLGLESSIMADELLFDTFDRMTEKTVDLPHIEVIENILFELDKKDLQNLSTRAKNNRNAFSDCVDLEFSRQGRNAWGLFNAVTNYTNWVANRDSKGKLKKSPAHAVMDGQGLKRNNQSFNYLEKLVLPNKNLV